MSSSKKQPKDSSAETQLLMSDAARLELSALDVDAPSNPTEPAGEQKKRPGTPRVARHLSPAGDESVENPHLPPTKAS
jgi:hypothetical protein